MPRLPLGILSDHGSGGSAEHFPLCIRGCAAYCSNSFGRIFRRYKALSDSMSRYAPVCVCLALPQQSCTISWHCWLTHITAIRITTRTSLDFCLFRAGVDYLVHDICFGHDGPGSQKNIKAAGAILEPSRAMETTDVQHSLQAVVLDKIMADLIHSSNPEVMLAMTSLQ